MILLGILLAAARPAYVKEYVRNPIALYDAGGTMIDRQQSAKMPKNAPIAGGPNGDGQYPIKLSDGRLVYVRAGDVIIEGVTEGVICDPSLTPAPRQTQRSFAAAEVGVASQMGSAKVSCIPRP